MQIWSMARLRLAAVDEAAGVATFTGGTVGTPYYQKFPTGGRYLIENVKEAGRPGDFYLDAVSGELTLWAREGETMGKVIAPKLPVLMELRGEPAERKWVEHLTFRGLWFAHTDWQTPPQGYCAIQAEVPLDAAIMATGGRHITFESCVISQTGAYGIALNESCSDNRITGCEFVDLGGGGIKIGSTRLPASEELASGKNRVENCLIAHGGRLHPAAVGIWLGHAPENTITRNEIVDFYYTGISPGWSWGYGPSLSRGNEVSYNHIHRIGQGVLSDMGGIYTLGAGGGNHIHHNLIHDVEAFSYGGWGIYLDEGSSDTLVENNVVYRTKGSGFNQHYGRNNTVRNNVFAFGREEQLSRGKPEPEHFTLNIHHNIVLYRDAPLLRGNWDGDNYTFASNLYWRADGKPVEFPGGLTLPQWQAKGQDSGSMSAGSPVPRPGKCRFQPAAGLARHDHGNQAHRHFGRGKPRPAL